MSDSIYEPGQEIDPDQPQDLDQAFGEENVEGIYETSWSPPDHEPTNTRFGTTEAEQLAGESLDARLAQELPDPALAVEDPLADPSGESADAELDQVDLDGYDPEDLRLPEVGDERAGRLVAPDEGSHADLDKDLVGTDVGIDGGAAAAEEAAVHVIDD